MSGILFFIFASCHPLNMEKVDGLSMGLWFKLVHDYFTQMNHLTTVQKYNQQKFKTKRQKFIVTIILYDVSVRELQMLEYLYHKKCSLCQIKFINWSQAILSHEMHVISLLQWSMLTLFPNIVLPMGFDEISIA